MYASFRSSRYFKIPFMKMRPTKAATSGNNVSALYSFLLIYVCIVLEGSVAVF